MMDLYNQKKAVDQARRCQRNWDHSNPVSSTDIQKIVEVAI